MRPSLGLCALVVATLLFTSAFGCKKKPDVGGGPGEIPSAVSSDLFFLAHVKAQDILNAPIMKEMKSRRFPVGPQSKDMGWDDLEKLLVGEVGIKPSAIDTVTFTFTFPNTPDTRRDESKFVIIVTATEDFDRDAIKRKFAKGPSKRSDFLALEPGLFIHFPDPKIAVVINEEFIDRYLAGFAKDRNAWPFNEGLKKAAEGHAVMLAFNVAKIPADARRGLPPEGANVMNARSALLVIDFKDDELVIGARGTYHDDASAKLAADGLKTLLAQFLPQIDKEINSESFKNTPPVLKQAAEQFRAAVNNIKPEADGKDVTANTSYKVNFTAADAILASVQKVRGVAAKSHQLNNLMQAGVGLHNFESQMGTIPVHGIGANGNPRVDPKTGPLLSWRVAILPMIEQDNLYRQFKLDEPWDSDHNKKLIDKMPAIFGDKSDVLQPGHTRLQMLIGPSLMQPGMGFPNISDGMSNTFGVVEAANPVIWTKPDDIMIAGDKEPKDLLKYFKKSPEGFGVMMWDGSVYSIKPGVYSNAELWALITPKGGEVVQIKP